MERCPLPRQMQQLTTDRSNGQRLRACDVDVARPTACRNDDHVGRQHSASRFDCDYSGALADAAHARFDEVRVVSTRRGDQRARQLACIHVAMRRNQQRAGDGVAKLRLFLARGVRIEQ